jgi:succinate dehydrogenase hydrophobic anchor subunit
VLEITANRVQRNSPDWLQQESSAMPLIHFALLATFFGLALFAATAAVIVLAGQPGPTWLWWLALIPLAVAHWVAGFLATWESSMANARDRAAVSAVTTILAITVAAWTAYAIGLPVPRHVAVLILIAASLAGLFGLGLAAWLRFNFSSKWRSP